MVGWHHQLSGREFAQAPGDSEGQGSLAGVLLSLGLQRVRHDLSIEQYNIHCMCVCVYVCVCVCVCVCVYMLSRFSRV